ncbi:MAG: hypothetical protein F4W95_14215 [Chloroflexi bacterium]|nr:hypothetical protein [Chloroflexota bacterium]MYD49615.1 hypothetical protein [Chloroflexota bacterium]
MSAPCVWVGASGKDMMSTLKNSKEWYEVLQPLLSCEVAAANQDTPPAWCHDLARLEELLAERKDGIDAFDFISRLYSGSGVPWLWSSEEFHSNLLAWLLDPNENHGLGDRFLKGFLSKTCAPSEVQSADWSQATVIREWENYVGGQLGYLDILVLNEARQCLLAIENKIFSSEQGQQLTRYRSALANQYDELQRHQVFLSPAPTQPESADERKHWQAAGYAVVLDVLKELTDRQNGEIAEDVRAFLMQYATTLRRNIVPDSSAQKTARKVYLANRELFETILASRPDYRLELWKILKAAVGSREDMEVVASASGWVAFVPKQWLEVEAQGTSSFPDLPLATFHFIMSNDNAYLNFGLYGGDENVREKIAAAIKESHGEFGRPSTPLNTGWTNFHRSDYILDGSHYSSWDEKETRVRINRKVACLIEKDVRRITNFIAQNVPEYKPKQV